MPRIAYTESTPYSDGYRAGWADASLGLRNGYSSYADGDASSYNALYSQGYNDAQTGRAPCFE